MILVLSRDKIKDFKTDVKHIIISITDPNNEEVVINSGCTCLDILRLQFHDLDKRAKKIIQNSSDKNNYLLFNKKEAKKIVNFIKKYLNKTNLIICQCEAGISRSAGVAAALSKYITGSDEYYFKHYIPNSLVYKLLLNELYKEKK